MAHLEPQPPVEPTTIVSSQSAFPARATWRTVVSYVLSSIIALGVIVPAVLAVLQEELGALIGEAGMGVLVAISGVVVAIAAALTRIMAIPAVDAALRRFGLSSTPKAPAPVTADGAHVITNVVDITALPGYETTEVSDAKTEVADILDQEHDGDNIATAEIAVQRLIDQGWRPTRES